MAEIGLDTPTLGESTSVTLTIVQAGAALTVCQPVYIAADLKYYPCRNTTVPLALAAGLAFTAAAADEDYFVMVTSGPVAITVGAPNMVKGLVYCVGNTAGSIESYTEVDAAEIVTVLGTALSTLVLDISIQATGAVK